MNEIEIKITFEDFDLKPAKPATNSSIVYVRKDWIGKTVKHHTRSRIYYQRNN